MSPGTLLTIPGGHALKIIARTLAVDYPNGAWIVEHEHAWDQLIYASQGSLVVETGQGNWVLPRNRALWMPAAHRHRVGSDGSFAMRTIYLQRSKHMSVPSRPCVIHVTPLLRELLLRLVRHEPSTLDGPEQQRLLLVLMDQLRRTQQQPIELSIPTDPLARKVAARIIDAPGGTESLDALARDVGCSKRTLERRFVSETGLTFNAWRQQARVLAALKLLAAGRTVSEVAFEVGYASPSSFVAMFSRVLGTSPGKYFEQLSDRKPPTVAGEG